jgi:hypothetical protein
MTSNQQKGLKVTETASTEPAPSHDAAIADLCKTLVNAFIKDSKNAYGDSALAKLQSAIKYDGNEAMWDGITALSTYLSVRAQERQATALESVAKAATRLQLTEAADQNAQAIVDQREPKREYLASTYSLPMPTLSLLWAVRGMLMDASVKSLSKPDRFDPYNRLSTDEIAWSLRLDRGDFYIMLPQTANGNIDYELLEAFDIVHYGGTDLEPDEWMFGG